MKIALKCPVSSYPCQHWIPAIFQILPIWWTKMILPICDLSIFSPIYWPFTYSFLWIASLYPLPVFILDSLSFILICRSSLLGIDRYIVYLVLGMLILFPSLLFAFHFYLWCLLLYKRFYICAVRVLTFSFMALEFLLLLRKASSTSRLPDF